jgi:hypothetical protein
MSRSFSAVGIFCEDIREEKNEMVTLVGIFPDFVKIESAGEMMKSPSEQQYPTLPKFCIYLRINFDPDSDLKDVQIRLAMENGEVIPLGGIPQSIIQQSVDESKALGNPIPALVTRVKLESFKIPSGLVRLEVVAENHVHLAGAITFTSIDPVTNA